MLPQQQYKEQEWYRELFGNCQAAWVEGNYGAMRSLVESRHEIGRMICEEAERSGVPLKDLRNSVSEDMQKSVRSIEIAVQLYKKFPLLEKAPFTKNETYRDIVHKYLPEIKKEKQEVVCSHEIIIRVCKTCKKEI